MLSVWLFALLSHQESAGPLFPKEALQDIWTALDQYGPESARASLRQLHVAAKISEETWKIVDASLLLCTGTSAHQALLSVLALVPFLEFDRRGKAAAYLLAAEAALVKGQTTVAAPLDARRLVSKAQVEVSFTSARSLRLPTQLMQAKIELVAGRPEEAGGHVRAARRLARTPAERALCDHINGWILVAERNEVESFVAFSSAQAHGLTDHQRLAARQDHLRAEQQFLNPHVSPAPLPPQRHVLHVSLLRDIALTVDGHYRTLPRSAQALLLLCYLETHDSVGRETVADLLLPPRQRIRQTTRDLHILEGYRVAELLKSVRQAVGNPACILASAGNLALSHRYQVSSDLNQALQDGTFRRHDLPAGLQCRWLDELGEAFGS